MFIAFFALLLGGLAHAGGCDDCNLLWIVIDTTRSDYVGAYGNPDGNTPNIDRLARRGTLVERAYAQGPATMVSVSSYFSGRYRLNNGMDFDMFSRDSRYHPLAPSLTTVAEALQARGFQTAGITANMIIAGGVQFDLQFYQGFQRWEKAHGDDAKVTAQGIAWLDELKDQRFLVYLHYMGPHHPNLQGPGFEGRRGHFRDGLPQADQHVYGSLNRGKLTLDDEGQRYLRALYADALWQADQQVGQVLDKLDALGLTDKTLVVVTADHGESLGELHNGKPTWGHGHALTEPLLHVPLVMAGPGVPKGQRLGDRMVELVDLGPTLASLLGVPVQADWGWDGHPFLGAGSVKGEWSISDRGLDPTGNSAIRDATHGVLYWQGGGGRFFYTDLVADPTETQWVQPDARHKQLQVTLQAYMDDAHPPARTQDIDAPDDETLKQLQELGYVGD